jgi:YbbR domain-containing protein
MNHLYRLFRSNRAMMVASVLIAIVIWIVVINQINPTSTIKIKGVSIQANETNQTPNALGLKIIEGQDQKVNIQVEGAYYIVGKLKNTDFSAVPVLSSVDTPGNHIVQMKVIVNQSISNVRIISVTPQILTFTFDRMNTKTLPIEVNLTGAKISDGYIMESPISSDATIKLDGPVSEITPATHAVVNIDISNATNKTVVTKNNIVLLDNKGAEVTGKHIVKSVDQVDVTIPILKRKTIPLKIQYANMPTDFDTGSINLQISPSTLDIDGPADAIDGINELIVGTVDFNKLTPKYNTNFNITLPTGIQSIQNILSASVQITLANYINKISRVSNFAVVNVPDVYTVKIHTQSIDNVVLLGKKTSLQYLSSTKLLGTVDMNKVSISEGQYQVPVTISAPGIGFVWATGDIKVLIEVKKK